MRQLSRTYLKAALLLASIGLYPGVISATIQDLPFKVFPNMDSLERDISNDGGTTDPGTAFAGKCDDTTPGMSIKDATSTSTDSDAFDNAWMLFVDDKVFAVTEVDLTDNVLTAGPVVLAGLNVQLEMLFPAILQVVRIRAIFENTSNNAISVDVDVPINLGSDAGTLIQETSSIDNVFSIGDRWIITSDSNVGPDDAVNTSVIYGPGTPVATPLVVTRTVCEDSKTQAEGLGFSFRITIPARASRSLMFFAGLGDIKGATNSVTDAITNAAMFNSNSSIDTRLLSDLPDAERLEILNWDFATTINTAAAEEDTTFIDDFLGCSLGKRKTNDPTFLLLVLLAMGGLFRNRVFRA